MQTLRQPKRLLPLSNDESFLLVLPATKLIKFLLSQTGQNAQ
jgi:hypothetical protein